MPGGGTNVFARALGIPRDPVEATGVSSPRCGPGAGARSASAVAGDRWFTFNAGMGWDAEVVARVDRVRRERAGAKRTTNRDYVRAALAEFFLPATAGTRR